MSKYETKKKKKIKNAHFLMYMQYRTISLPNWNMHEILKDQCGS